MRVEALGLAERHRRRAVRTGGALAVGGVGTALRRTQTGFVRSYALSLVAGAILVVVALLAVNLA
jgi:NADH-quinone oxidoreductase subunit L